MTTATNEIKVGDKVIWDTFKKFRSTHLGVVTAIVNEKEAKVQREKNGRKVTTTVQISSLELYSKRYPNA